MSKQTQLTKKVVTELVKIVEASVLTELGEVERKSLKELFTEVINQNFWRTYNT